jgi:hypothetical protein
MKRSNHKHSSAERTSCLANTFFGAATMGQPAVFQQIVCGTFAAIFSVQYCQYLPAMHVSVQFNRVRGLAPPHPTIAVLSAPQCRRSNNTINSTCLWHTITRLCCNDNYSLQQWPNTTAVRLVGWLDDTSTPVSCGQLCCECILTVPEDV